MQHLAGDLPNLTGCVLACDCEMDMVCEGDALAGLVFEFGRPPARATSGQVRQVLAAIAGDILGGIAGRHETAML